MSAIVCNVIEIISLKPGRAATLHRPQHFLTIWSLIKLTVAYVQIQNFEPLLILDEVVFNLYHTAL